jgi:hypothetical protein
MVLEGLRDLRYGLVTMDAEPQPELDRLGATEVLTAVAGDTTTEMPQFQS